ncbi:MAG: hypothetical protein WCB49_11710 [Gammaproteobacteria bacterium]
MALILAAELVALAPRATLAATYFTDTFNQPSPLSADWVVYDGENLPSATVDTGVGTADRRFGLSVEPFDGNIADYHQSYSCAGSDCPAAGDTAWYLHFDPAYLTETGTSGTDTGVTVETQYFFESPANFTAGGNLALDFASYDTRDITSVVGQVVLADTTGFAQTINFDLPTGVLQSTPTRLLLDYSALPLDLANIVFLQVFFEFKGTGGSFTMDKLSTVSAISTTPMPAALPLFASGLGVLGLLGWRRKKKVAAPVA